jgi:hypothetical protein
VKFGPSSRLHDVLHHPDARRALDAAFPGVGDHPSLAMMHGSAIAVLVDGYLAELRSKSEVSAFWAALGEIESPDRHRGIGVASRPLPDYEGDDVAEASAVTSLPDAVACLSTLDVTFTGPSHGNPFTDVELTARFTRDSADGEQPISVGGFYDGDGRWIIRFLPEATGRWRFTTASNARSLNGITGSFEVTEASPGDRGPVRADGFHFAHADGTRHLPLGTTAYAWIHQPAEMRAATLRGLAGSPFTKLRMCVFPKSYQYNTDEPELYPFPRQPRGRLRLHPLRPGVLPALGDLRHRTRPAGHRSRRHPVPPL